MGVFDFLKAPDINRGVEEFSASPEGVLIDVRTPQEYRQGHIPGSRNLPLDTLDSGGEIAENKNTPLFVYCYSGARSRQAAAVLQRRGYTNVKNLGGIASYSGKVER